MEGERGGGAKRNGEAGGERVEEIGRERERGRLTDRKTEIDGDI